MRIGELAELTGVDVETVRYYEKSGLLSSPARSSNGYRKYGAAHLERLAFIRHCRALDMPLAEVSRLLNFLDHPTSDCGDVNVLVDEQIGRVKARLKSMRALHKQLTALRRQCAEPHSIGECGILHELVAAAHGEACVCHVERRPV
jgi:Cd(II)/Pb(II)-responsive transcriptional regulator